MSKTGMMAAVAAAAGLGEDQVQNLTVDAAFIAAHFPEAAKALREDGASAEHERVRAIEAAAMPGHEAIIAAHKADRSKTGADAALAVIAAERGKLAAIKAGLDADEERLSGLTAAAAPAAAAETAANPHAQAAELSNQATAYINEQKAKGITVSAAEAVAHITRKG